MAHYIYTPKHHSAEKDKLKYIAHLNEVWFVKLYFSVVNPTPKHAGGGMDSPSDLPSQLDYPAIIMEQPLEEEGTTFD